MILVIISVISGILSHFRGSFVSSVEYIAKMMIEMYGVAWCNEIAKKSFFSEKYCLCYYCHLSIVSLLL